MVTQMAKSGKNHNCSASWRGYRRGSCWLPGCWSGESCDQGGNERAEEGFAATACIVHELEEAEVKRQLLLREPPVRPQPGAQQGPEAFDGVDVHLAEAVAVLVAGVFTLSVADALVLVAQGASPSPVPTTPPPSSTGVSEPSSTSQP